MGVVNAVKISWLAAAGTLLAACGSTERPRPEIVLVSVSPSAQSTAAFAAPANTPLILDITVEPAFALDFDPQFGDDAQLVPRGGPAHGRFVPTTGGEPVAFDDRISLRAPDMARVNVDGLPAGNYVIVLDDGVGGEMEHDVELQIREAEPVGSELYVDGLPDVLLADECVKIEVGFVAEGTSGPFLAPPRLPDDSDILIELVDFQDGVDRTVDGLAITGSGVCGQPSITAPAARVSSQQPTAYWYVRGRRPGLASVGVVATGADSGGFVASRPASEQRVLVRGRVEAVPEQRLWLPGECQEIRWVRTNPVGEDAYRPPVEIELEVRDQEGNLIDVEMYGDASCQGRVEYVGLVEGELSHSKFVRLDELGVYTVGGRIREPNQPPDHGVGSATVQVAASAPVSDLTVTAPSVTGFGTPMPVVLEAPQPTRCELVFETVTGVPLIEEEPVVDVEGRTLVWITPKWGGANGDDVQGVLRCVEEGFRPRATSVALGTCAGVALDESALRLELANRAPTPTNTGVDVSLRGASGASSVLYVLGSLESPEGVRLDPTGDGGMFRFQAPTSDGVRTITAIVRDFAGCPVTVEDVIYAGADSTRVVSIRPGSLHEQLEDRDLSDSSPLVLVFTPDTVINTVKADGALLGRIASELYLLGPGSGALLEVSGDVSLRSDSFWSWIDIHGSGRIIAESGTFTLRDSLLRQDVWLDLRGALATIGPRAYLEPGRVPSIHLGEGVVARSMARMGSSVPGSAPMILVDEKAYLVQNAIADVPVPFVGAPSGGDAVELEFEFNTFHGATPVDVARLPEGSQVFISGGLFSRLPDWSLPQLSTSGVTVVASAAVGVDLDESICSSEGLTCDPNELFLDPTRPEWLTYSWCDEVAPSVSEWDKIGYSDIDVDDGGARYHGLGYDFGHLERVVSVPGRCP